MRSDTAPWIIARGHSSRGSSRQGRGAALRQRVRRALRWTGRHSFYATARRARRRPGRRTLDPSVEERSRVVTRRVEPTERHTGDRQPDAPRAVAGLVSIRFPVAGRRLRRVPGRALRHCVACAADRRVVRRSACRPGDAIAQGCQQSFHVYGHHSITGRLAHSARPRVSLLGQRPGSTMTGLSTRAWSGLVSAR